MSNLIEKLQPLLDKCKPLWIRYKTFYHSLDKPKQVVFTIICVFSFWMLSGIFVNHKEHAKPHEKINDYGFKFIESIAQKKTRIIELNAVTEGSAAVQIAPEVTGKIINILATQGKHLKKGDPIIEIDPKNYAEAFEQHQASFNEMKIAYNSAQNLYAKKLSSEIDLAKATTNYQKALSELKLAKINLENTVIRAPFDGVVDYIQPSVGELVSPSTPYLATFANLNPIKIVSYIPEKDIENVLCDTCVTVTTLSGKKYKGTITFVSKVADPSTRSFRIEVFVENSNEKLLIGETVSAAIEAGEYLAHKIPSSAIVLNTNGTFAVKVINDKNIIESYPVTLINEDINNAWVSGLPEKTKILILGQMFLKAGEDVSSHIKTS